MMVSFAFQKLFILMKSNLLIVGLSACTISVRFKMEPPYYREDNAPTGQLMPPNKILSTRNGFHRVASLAKEVTWNPSSKLHIAKAIGFAPLWRPRDAGPFPPCLTVREFGD